MDRWDLPEPAAADCACRAARWSRLSGDFRGSESARLCYRDPALAVSHIIADGLTALCLLHKLVEHAHRLTVAQGDDDVVESRPVIDAPDDLLPARRAPDPA